MQSVLGETFIQNTVFHTADSLPIPLAYLY